MACPFDHPFFDVKEQVTVKCDFCDGDPQCVAFCYAKAVLFAEPDQMNKAKKREAANKFLESIKQIR
jgi:Fe-S-cluster-containing dehydrogenase component